jgi:hypothetical protein
VIGWLLALLAAALVLLVVALAARRRTVARETRRVQALERLADRLEVSIAEVRPPTFPPFESPTPADEGVVPLLADRLPGRTALLEGVAVDVEHAGAGSTRLTVVLVRVAGATAPEALLEAVREVTGRPAYAVGPSAVAFTLPGLGRAGGLGALARIEARIACTGHAAEWAPGETPVELVARLLGAPPTNDAPTA